VSKSSIPSLEGLDVCHSRHHIYLFFSSLRVMRRIPTALHLHVAHDDDISRQLANCDVKYKFFLYIHIVCYRNLQWIVR